MIRPKRIMYVALSLAGLALLLAACWLLFTVDDWSRDLTTNRASTSPAARNPSLRPIVSTLPASELADRAQASARQLPGWEVAGREEASGEISLRFIRTTRLMRFKDDITVHVRPLAAEGEALCEVSAHSKSRVGKADFGQNPRNLAELMDKLRSSLR